MTTTPERKNNDKQKSSPKKHGNLTIYGRKPVLEALQDSSVKVLRVHLSRSNKASDSISEIKQLSEQLEVPISRHSKLELSRISKNSRQDQGVAADLSCNTLREASKIGKAKHRRLIALDRINNPQNLGMAIRSIAAGYVDGLLLSREAGTTRLSPLVIKASAGTFFRTPIYQCDELLDTLRQLQESGYAIICLNASASQSLFEMDVPKRCIFVLGNESDGISEQITALADIQVAIPLKDGVESLNVAVTAALVSFLEPLRSST